MQKLLPDGLKIKELRERLGYTQNELVEDLYRKHDVSLGLKTYQNLEMGKECSEKVLNTVAVFFDRYLQVGNSSSWHNSNDFTSNSLVINNEKYKTDLPDLDKVENEEIYLHKIDKFDQFTFFRVGAQYRKFVYEFTPGPNEVKIISEVIQLMSQTNETYKSGSTWDNEDTNNEINKLKRISSEQFTFHKMLSENKINIYVNIFTRSIYHPDITPDGILGINSADLNNTSIILFSKDNVLAKKASIKTKESNKKMELYAKKYDKLLSKIKLPISKDESPYEAFGRWDHKNFESKNPWPADEENFYDKKFKISDLQLIDQNKNISSG